MWMGIVVDCVISVIFLMVMVLNLLLIGLMKSVFYVMLSWGDWFFGMLLFSILLVLLVFWLVYVLYLLVLKFGDQVLCWVEMELQVMGLFCLCEKWMLGLMVGVLVLWIFGGDYIDVVMVGYSVVVLMLFLCIISWDDIVSNKVVWNVFFWLVLFIIFVIGFNNIGFISWFGKLLVGSLSGYLLMMVMVVLIVVFYLLCYFFVSVMVYIFVFVLMMIVVVLVMLEILLLVFCLMVGVVIGLGSIFILYVIGFSLIYYGSGYLLMVDYW